MDDVQKLKDYILYLEDMVEKDIEDAVQVAQTMAYEKYLGQHDIIYNKQKLLGMPKV